MQRAISRVSQIDAARLAQVASDPTIKSGAIARIFGCGRANFFAYLSTHEELWSVYADARQRAGFKVNRRPHRRGILDADEIKILEAIAGGARDVSILRAAAIAAGVAPHRVSVVLYNLENEKHEIHSRAEGKPPVTRFYLRGEEPFTAEGTEESVEQKLRRWNHELHVHKKEAA